MRILESKNGWLLVVCWENEKDNYGKDMTSYAIVEAKQNKYGGHATRNSGKKNYILKIWEKI